MLFSYRKGSIRFKKINRTRLPANTRATAMAGRDGAENRDLRGFFLEWLNRIFVLIRTCR